MHSSLEADADRYGAMLRDLDSPSVGRVWPNLSIRAIATGNPNVSHFANRDRVTDAYLATRTNAVQRSLSRKLEKRTK